MTYTEFEKIYNETYREKPVNSVVLVEMSGKNYLFSVPPGVRLQPGDRVICETKNGISEGFCNSHDLAVNTIGLYPFVILTKATFPLKSVVGRYSIVRF